MASTFYVPEGVVTWGDDQNGVVPTKDVQIHLLAYVNGERKFVRLITRISPSANIRDMRETFEAVLQLEIEKEWFGPLDIRVVDAYVV